MRMMIFIFFFLSFYAIVDFVRVLVKGTLSDVVGRRSGVPKETSFSPLLFSLYASSLFDVIHTHLPSIQAH